MQHQAPTNDGFNAPLYDLTKVYPKDIYSSNGVRYYGEGANYDYESIRKIERVKDKPESKIRVYRAVPKDVREDNIRVGDWVTLSLEYAHLHGKSHIKSPYRIMVLATKAKNLWSDGNSINELGFDDGKTYAYQNTKNNSKLLDPVTYDSDGSIIPLSKRFNKKNYDVRFSLDQTETKEFKNWFGDSKVVDKEGKPLVVHHGTDKEFYEFNYSSLGKNGTLFGIGFYFANNKNVASNYGSKVLKSYLNIKKPLSTTKKQ